jgi:8-oxo-dGTP diphosphatase
MANPDWVDPLLWYQQLPTVHVAAMALIRDSSGRVLLVKPNYRPHWTLPGGMADQGETPNVTVAREIREELGITFTPAHLAVIDWAPPQGNRKKPLLAFVFNAGTIEDAPDISLQRSELDDWRFVALSDMSNLMSPASTTRVNAAARAAEQHSTFLLINGIEMTTTPNPALNNEPEVSHRAS